MGTDDIRRRGEPERARVQAVETVFAVDDAAMFAAFVRLAADADGRIGGAFGHEGVLLLRRQLLHADAVQFIFVENVENTRDACLPVVGRLVAARAEVEGADADAVGFFRNVFVKNDFLDDGRRWRLRFRFLRLVQVQLLLLQ